MADNTLLTASLHFAQRSIRGASQTRKTISSILLNAGIYLGFIWRVRQTDHSATSPNRLLGKSIFVNLVFSE